MDREENLPDCTEAEVEAEEADMEEMEATEATAMETPDITMLAQAEVEEAMGHPAEMQCILQEAEAEVMAAKEVLVEGHQIVIPISPVTQGPGMALVEDTMVAEEEGMELQSEMLKEDMELVDVLFLLITPKRFRSVNNYFFRI